MRVTFLLLLLTSLLVGTVGGDIFHYYKLKKFLTAVAFARALGRRPTILPVPIPIPIPIGQNEVIRIPSGGSKKVMTLMGSPKYSGGFSSGGFSSGGGGKFTGSSPYGYSLPGSFDSSLGESNVMVLDGNNVFDASGGSEFASSSNVIRLVSGKQQRFLNKPRRYIVMGGGGRTMRNSENIEWVQPPVRQYRGKKSSSTKRKKPIPVGEKFRLP